MWCILTPRRALEPEEMEKLVDSARSSGVVMQGYTGEQRARVYIFSYLTGLRRSEMGSIFPTSFDLDAEQPTVRVKAAFSKHRRKDVLPLHPDLIPMIGEWLAGLGPNDPLFPKLDEKRTWDWVRKDLERVGIPYKTEDGIADFHAAGRHTHITGLLRNGATLAEARELARHSDVRMTMKYTHIDIEDQAKALANLPTERKWLHIGCNPGHTDRHDVTQRTPKTHATHPAKKGVLAQAGTTRHRLTRRPKQPAAVYKTAVRNCKLLSSGGLNDLSRKLQDITLSIGRVPIPFL